ncbi:cation:proton antiporter [Candidatus Woesearchaeota archaeon]|nr:cation:proton antiporter [Candidatus Woesearchaeota archaeon]
MEAILYDIGLIIIVSTLIGFVIKFFKQPMIFGYMLAGLILGPHIMGKIVSQDTILGLSELGITFLLFIVGLEFNLKKLKEVSSVVFFGGSIQVAATTAAGILISLWLGFKFIEATYFGLIIALSSTLVVVKWLADKKEIDTLHGRIAIGILIIQDIVAIIALTFFSNINNFSFAGLGIAMLKGIVLVLSAYILNRPLQKIFAFASKFGELLFISSLSLCFIFAFIAQYLGFSISIGAFIAGIMIANLPYSLELIGKIKSIANFFTVLFFASLGLQLSIPSISKIVVPVIVMLAVVLIIKPLITIFAVKIFGYKSKTAFLSGVSLAQTSEFSLIIAALGVAQGHISQEIFAMTILLAVITIGASSYLIKYGNLIYYKIGKYIFLNERMHATKHEETEEHSGEKISSDIIIFGYEGVDHGLLERFKAMKKSITVVDLEPDVIRRLKSTSICCIYGDPSEFEIINKLALENSEVIISTVHDVVSNLHLIKKTREVNKKAIIISAANRIKESLELYEAGADYVVLPHLLGESQVSVVVENFSKDINTLIAQKLKHIDELKKREELQKQAQEFSKDSFMDIDRFIGMMSAPIKRKNGTAEKQVNSEKI